MNWYVKVLKQYADFKGRARRKEYWMFFLIHLLILIGLSFLLVFISGGLVDNGEPSSLGLVIIGGYFLATIVPTLAVTIRRLHDTDKSGWWYLITLVPYIGSFIILIFTCMESYHGTNKWGENPKGVGNEKLINQIGKE